MSAREAAAAIERGVRAGWPEAASTLVPMADGGEGTVDAFLDAGWRRHEATVTGPLGAPVAAAFAYDGETAIVELAAASGLALVPTAERDPRRASSAGTGELVRAALDAGARRIVIAVGGSATNDGGAGFLQALGVRFLDAAGEPLGPGGAELRRLARVDASGRDPRLDGIIWEVAADVDHPLTGPRGASAVFGPQKGATPADVRELDAALERFAEVSAGALGRDLRAAPGAGAAGGFGFAALAYLGAALRPGWEIVAGMRGLATQLESAQFALTGEGRIDAQTAGGKTVAGVARLARAAGVPLVAFGGKVDAGAEAALARAGVVCVPISDGPRTLDEALRDAGELLARAAERVARLLRPR